MLTIEPRLALGVASSLTTSSARARMDTFRCVSSCLETPRSRQTPTRLVKLQYAIGVSGHKGAKILGNKVRIGEIRSLGAQAADRFGLFSIQVSGKANFGGVDSAACFSGWFPLPSPQPFIADPTNTPSSTFQDDFWLKSVLVLLICKGPGAILSSITA